MLWVRLDQLRRPSTTSRWSEQVLPFKEASGVGYRDGSGEGLRDEAASTLAPGAGRGQRPTLLHHRELASGNCRDLPPQHAVDCLRWRTIGSLVADVVFERKRSPRTKSFLEPPGGVRTWTGLLTHPSLRLASDLHILFLSTLRVRRSRHGRAGEILGSRVSGLVRAYWPKLVKPPPGMLEAGELTDPIFDEEFVDEEELVSFFGQMRGQLSSVLRLLGEHFPGPAAAVTRDILRAPCEAREEWCRRRGRSRRSR